jgi:putative ABC transport system permease protein
VPPGRIGIYVSEAVVDLYGVHPGGGFALLEASFRPLAPVESAQTASFFVAGVWRDYARQFGTVAMAQEDFERLSKDRRVNDIAFWLAPDSDLPATEQALRAIANRLARTPDGEAGALLEFGSAQEIRATTLKIFDRSFAVTYWLQAVAIGIGLFGVAASFSAQVLARRKEFGLLVHLGLTRRQVLQVVAAEGAAWTTLATAVVAAGTFTAWVAGRAAAGKDAVLAVKEDW